MFGNNFSTTMGLDIMSTTESHAKKRGTKMNATEKKEAQMVANRRARMQWYALGAFLVVAVVLTLVIVTIYTEGEIFSLGGGPA
jgi:predicted nucleic acid-binding Zn ribbon protein